MKRLLTLAVVALMLALTLVFPVSAAESVSTEVELELKSRTEEAFEFLLDFYISASLDYDNQINIFDYVPSTEYPSQYGVKDHSTYCKRNDLYADWNEYENKALCLFTESTASDFIKYSGAYNLEGSTYCTVVLNMSQSTEYYLNWSGSDINTVNYDESFKVVSSSDNEVVVEFKLYNEFPKRNENHIETHNFTFTNTTDGWRISDGTLLDVFFVQGMLNAPSFAPQTGFATAIYAAVAVVSAAAVVAVGKKWR